MDSKTLQCLLIPEIICLISEELANDNKEHQISTLAAMARTCRAWTEPALDSLWYEIRGLQTLFMTLPQDVWKKKPGQDLVVLKPLTQSDVQTLKKYTPRVRVLFEGMDPPISTYEALQAVSPSFDPIFPRLKDLKWPPMRPQMYSYIRNFLCPSLRMLHIQSFDNLTVGTLGLDVSICPNLTRLYLGLEHTDIAPAELSDALSAWNLQQLVVSGIPVDMVQCLVKIPTIRILEAQPSRMISRKRTPPQFLLPPPDAIFSSEVELLHVFGIEKSEPFMQYFLQFRLQHLRDLSFAFSDDHIKPRSLEGFISWITNSCDLKTLESAGLRTNVDHEFAFSAVILPFLKFRNLKKLSLVFRRLAPLLPEDIEVLASSCPSLETLELTSPTPIHSLSSLIPLARGLRNINALYVTIDASDPADLEDFRKHPEWISEAKNWSLSSLCVIDGSIIADKQFVTSFLSELFPVALISFPY